MNKVILMGRLTRDPEVRYSSGDSSMAIARYTLAVDRRFRRNGDGEQTADFIGCVAFGKSAEFAERYFRQGLKIVVTGRIQTGSYTNKDGQKVYTTDVVVEDQEFAESKAASMSNGGGGGYEPSAPAPARPAPSAASGDGFMNIPDGVLMDLNHIKSLPKEKICIITTGSQGEAMSALSRMAFNTHRQVDIQAGDRIIISASTIPGNENSMGNVINELYRKGAEVVNERERALHVSGHACQEELKIIHALVKPKYFIPLHGEQRHLKLHAKLAREMGMDANHILISDLGRVIELTPNSAKLGGTVTAGQVFVDGYGVGDVGSVVLRDRRHLAQDGMIVVVMAMSGDTGELVSGPDLITRGFVYVKESEELMDELKQVAQEAAGNAVGGDWAAIKGAVKGDLSAYLYKKTKRSPMILPVIMEV